MEYEWLITHFIARLLLRHESHASNDTADASADDACTACDSAFGVRGDVVRLEDKHAGNAELQKPDSYDASQSCI